MRILILVILILVFLVFPDNVFAGGEQIGTTSASFIKVGAGARPTGMGEAFTAVSNDINAIQYNPAGIANLRRNELSLIHIEWFQELRYEVLTYGFPIKNSGVIGIYILYFWTEKMEKLDETGSSSGEYFRVTGINGILSYATEPFEKVPLRAGCNLKIIQESLEDVNSSSFAFDIGLQYDLSKVITIGSSIQNISSGMKYSDKEFQVPKSTNIGMLINFYDSVDYKFLTTIDCNFPNDSEDNIRVGIEYWFEKFVVRAGYKLKSGGEELGALAGLKSGLGYRTSFKKGLNYGLDYTFEILGDLGFSHRVALLLFF